MNIWIILRMPICFALFQFFNFQLENVTSIPVKSIAVYIELRKRYYENIFYFKTTSGKQVDFVTQKLNGKLELFQVCVDLSEERTKQWEISALIEAAKELNLDEGWIITNDTSEMLEIDSVKITLVPYWEWVIEYGS